MFISPLVCFWVLAFIFFYIYLGYPVLVYIFGRVKNRPVTKDERYMPRVTVITSAYNEEKAIEETVRNKMAVQYPREKLEYIIVSDGSTDATDEIVTKLVPEAAANGLKLELLRQNERQGKTAAMNRAVAAATGEIIINADANSLYSDDTVLKLVRNFADPEVGYVTGRMVYVTRSGSSVSEGCGVYMQYENLLRAYETEAGSVVGVDGGVDAFRKSLYRPMDAGDLPDFVLPLSIVEQGKRVVFEPEAVVREDALSEAGREFTMRIRVAQRSYAAIKKMAKLLNVATYGQFAVQLWSHKVLRYAAPVVMIALFIANIEVYTDGVLYAILLWAQLFAYAAALAGFVFEKLGKDTGIFYVPYYFCLINIASLVAFVRFLKGERITLWKPREG